MRRMRKGERPREHLRFYNLPLTSLMFLLSKSPLNLVNLVNPVQKIPSQNFYAAISTAL
jgi:hypothetical protein